MNFFRIKLGEFLSPRGELRPAWLADSMRDDAGPVLSGKAGRILAVTEERALALVVTEQRADQLLERLGVLFTGIEREAATYEEWIDQGGTPPLPGETVVIPHPTKPNLSIVRQTPYQIKADGKK